MLSGKELDELADKVVTRLNGSVISSALPANLGEYIRVATGGLRWQVSHWVPLAGQYGLQMEWVIENDGVIRLEMSDPAGWVFWRGVFRAEKTDANSDH